MRTKFSRTVLAVGIALALAFTFSCSSGGGSGGGNEQNGEGSSSSSKPSSSSSKGNANYSSGGTVSIDIRDFEVFTSDRLVYIGGFVYATIAADPIVKVTYSISPPGKLSWISYEGSPLTGPIIVNEQRIFDLDARIDLRNEEIPCGVTYSVIVEAWTKSGKKATISGIFTKPDNLCSVGGSSSAGGASSSSEAVWVFGNPETIDDVPLNTSIPIGSGSFKIIPDDPDAPDIFPKNITVSGGRIRRVVGVEAVFDEEGVVPDKAYSSKESFLGSTVPSTSTMIFTRGVGVGVGVGIYYLIYLDDNSKYLLKFTSSGVGYECTYWRATKSP